MSMKLRDLIKNIRTCKTAADERATIAKECAEIRTSIKEEQSEFRQRNIAKLLYIHMMGYPTHFGQMECLKLIVSPHYSDKRIGYLGLMLLLDERQEVLMLVTNSLKNDLFHQNQYVVGLALCSLANLATQDIARDLAEDVSKLFKSTNPYIRKKAALCAIKLIRKAPELIETFMPHVRSLLSERNHGVILTAISMLIELCEMDVANIEQFRKLAPTIVRILKNLVLSGYAPEYDVAGVTDPFLQVKLLRLLRILGTGNPEASDAMNDILAQVATNTEGVRNVGNSILYECVQTIMSVEAESGLRVLAINILGRFLLNRDNNIRYVALNTLSKVVSADIQAVQRHSATIVDCLKDHDISIRRRALDLVYALVNESNIRMLVRELLNFLLTADIEFRTDLTAKICIVTEKFAPSKKWHIDTILRVMSISGEYIPEQVVSNLVALVSHSPELQMYAVQKVFLALSQDIVKQPLVQLGMWCIGEFGDVLVNGGVIPPSEDSPEEQISPVREVDVIDLCERILVHPLTVLLTKQITLTTLLKLTDRFKDPTQQARIRQLFEKYSTSINVEVQQRSCEYLTVLRALDPQLRTSILDKMPAMEEKETVLTKSTDTAPAAKTPSGGLDTILNGGSQTTSTGVDLLKDLVGPTPTTETKAAPAKNVDDILSFLSPTPSAPTASAPKAASSLLDLLATPTTPVTQQPLVGGLQGLSPVGMAVPGASPLLMPMGGMGGMGGMGTAMPGAVPVNTSGVPLGMAAAMPSLNFPPLTVLEKDGLTIRFDLAKQPNDPSLSIINIRVSNSQPQPLTNFVLQAAVPTYLKLQLGQPSGNTVAPNNSARLTQQIKLANTMHGQKPVLLKVKVAYNFNGQPVTEMFEVRNFPVGF